MKIVSIPLYNNKQIQIKYLQIKILFDLCGIIVKYHYYLFINNDTISESKGILSVSSKM